MQWIEAMLPTDMRFVVIRPGGKFVVMREIPGSNPRTTYVMITEDSQDAHDLGSREAAARWVRQHGGSVGELTDSGHWPVKE